VPGGQADTPLLPLRHPAAPQRTRADASEATAPEEGPTARRTEEHRRLCLPGEGRHCDKRDELLAETGEALDLVVAAVRPALPSLVQWLPVSGA
jgi:hypothetical protein